MNEFKFTYEIAENAGLGFGYNPMMGNIILEKDEQTPENIANVIELLKKYPYDLVMGYEGEGEDQYLFVVEKIFLVEN